MTIESAAADEELARLAWRGDQAAAGEMLERFTCPAQELAREIVPDAQLADSLAVQAVRTVSYTIRGPYGQPLPLELIRAAIVEALRARTAPPSAAVT